MMSASCGGLNQTARFNHARGEPIGNLKTLFDLAQRQDAAIRRQQPAVKFDNIFLLETGDRQGNGSIGSFMTGVAPLKPHESASITRFYAKSVT